MRIDKPRRHAGSGGQRAGTLALLEALRQAADRTAAAQRPGSAGGPAANAAADDEEQLLLDSQARWRCIFVASRCLVCARHRCNLLAATT